MVNVASRMESTCQANCIQVSQVSQTNEPKQTIERASNKENKQASAVTPCAREPAPFRVPARRLSDANECPLSRVRRIRLSFGCRASPPLVPAGRPLPSRSRPPLRGDLPIRRPRGAPIWSLLRVDLPPLRGEWHPRQETHKLLM
eukprot:272853-Prorocentrum_minimum.AAC.1